MKTTLTFKQLEHFKIMLLDLKKEVLLELYKGQEDLALANSEHDIDNYMLCTNSAILQDKKYYLLKAINKALEKIANGTYGICEETNELIPLKRLEIIPYTTYTVQGAQLRQANAE